MAPKVTEYIDFCMYEYIFAIKIFLGKKGLLICFGKKICSYLVSWVLERKGNLKRSQHILMSEVFI